MAGSQVGLVSLRGTLLVTLITSVCSSGFLLFGYDQGVMGGVTISRIWLQAMGNPSNLMLGTITALYDVGAFFGAVAAAFTAEPLGRKRTLVLGSVVLIVGTILLGAAFERIQFMVGRVVTGIGIGYICSVCAVYQSEIASTAHRGWQVACQLSTMLFGLMLAYWINYGFYFHHSSIQWRFPLLFQCVFAIYIVVLSFFLPDTPRWLLRHNPDPQVGTEVVARLRNKSPRDAAVVREVQNILDALALEQHEEGAWSDLVKGNGVAANKRFALAVGIQWMQQMTGINIVTYYAPTLYQSSLGMSQQMALFLGCWTQVWYVVASLLTWYTIDRVGRRKLFVTCALGCSAVLVAEAVCVAIGGTSASVAAVVFVWLFEGFFTWGWMTTVWIYPAEILPLRIRAKGASLAAAADFLGNFLVVEVTPIGLQNIGWRFYLVWAVLNLVNAVIVFFFYPETGALQLEAIDQIFIGGAVGGGKSNGTSIEPDDDRWYRKIQWNKVGKSVAASKAARRRIASGLNGDRFSEDGLSDAGSDQIKGIAEGNHTYGDTTDMKRTAVRHVERDSRESAMRSSGVRLERANIPYFET